MSDIEREAFEKWFENESGYDADVRCILKDSWLSALEWQAARAQDAEPVEGRPLPCPFCGKAPQWEPHEDPTYPQVECRNLECPIGMVRDEVSLESWNTRRRAHPPAANQGVLEGEFNYDHPTYCGIIEKISEATHRLLISAGLDAETELDKDEAIEALIYKNIDYVATLISPPQPREDA